MADPADEPAVAGLFEQMTAEGHAAFALACASDDVTVEGERERSLVEAAITAGVVGALSVLRDDDQDAKP